MMWWIMIIIWSVVFIGTLVLELLTADIDSIWFTISSVICLIIACFKVDYRIQIIVFICLSIVLIIATRPLTKKLMDREIVKTNTDKLVGEIGTITKELSEDEIGELKVDNQIWRCISRTGESYDIGEKVVVIGISGNKLIISKAKKSNTNYNAL